MSESTEKDSESFPPVVDQRRDGAHEADASSLIAAGQVLLEERRLIIRLGFLGALAGAALALFLPRNYVGVASFTPQATELPSGVSGLAAQFGFSLPSGAGGFSPEFYADLLQTRALLEQVIDSPFVVEQRGPFGRSASADSLHQPYAELVDVSEDDPVRQRQKEVAELRDQLSIDVTRRTGIVTVRATTRWRGLSDGIVRRALALVADFNLTTRQNRAGAERIFVEERASEARVQLEKAEQELQRFLQQNRSFRDSPELLFAHDRLERTVALQQQVYTSLAQAFEQARIEEVRNTPVITIVQPPSVPLLESRQLILKTLVGIIFGLSLGAAIAVVRHSGAIAKTLAP